MHHLRPLLRPLRVIALIATTLLGAATAASAAGTAAASTPLQPGWNVEASTVACPGQAARTLTSEQTATFLQSWLPDAFFSSLKIQDPPPGVTRCTVAIPSIIEGQPPRPPSPVDYATNGKRVWVRLPPGKWSVAKQTQRVIDSFAGHGTYVPVATVAPTTIASSTTVATPASHASRSSSNKWVWVAVAAPVAVLFILARMRSRRGGSARGKSMANRHAS